MARRLIAATVQPRFSGGAPFRSGVVLLNAARVKSVYAENGVDIIRYETNGVREYTADPIDGISMTQNLTPFGVTVVGGPVWDSKDRFKLMAFPLDTLAYARPAYIPRLKNTRLEGMYLDLYLDEGGRYRKYFMPASFVLAQNIADTSQSWQKEDVDLDAFYLNLTACAVQAEDDDDDDDADRAIAVSLDGTNTDGTPLDVTRLVVDYQLGGFVGYMAYLNENDDDDDDDNEWVILKPGDTIDGTNDVTLGLFDVEGTQRENFILSVTVVN